MKFVGAAAFLALIALCTANPLPQNGDFGAEITKNKGSKPNLNVYGSQKWENDKGSVDVFGNHERELGGQNRHQTNVGVQGSYDVFDNGKTKGTVFGGANQQWNSDGPNNKGYEYGGRIEHKWGR